MDGIYSPRDIADCRVNDRGGGDSHGAIALFQARPSATISEARQALNPTTSEFKPPQSTCCSTPSLEIIMSDVLQRLNDLGSGTEPKSPSPKKPISKAPSFTPVQNNNPDSEDLIKSFMALILSDECSDSERDLVFATMARATGRNLVVTSKDVISNILTFFGLFGIVIILVKGLLFAGLKQSLFASVAPIMLGLGAFTLLILAVVFRRHSDIIPVLLHCAIALMMASFATSMI